MGVEYEWSRGRYDVLCQFHALNFQVAGKKLQSHNLLVILIPWAWTEIWNHLCPSDVIIGSIVNPQIQEGQLIRSSRPVRPEQNPSVTIPEKRDTLFENDAPHNML